MLSLSSLALCAATLSGIVSAGNAPIKKTLTGHIDASEVFSFVYAPFEVEIGTTSIHVVQNYSAKDAGNAVDLGIFDQRGRSLAASRGWSGGVREQFTITPSWATPGYNPGPIEPGTWSVVLGPYTSIPEGIDWQLDIEMGFDPVDSYFAIDPAAINMDPLCNGRCTADGEWLRGDFHVHTVYSDGTYTPDEQMRIAVDQGLDFIFFTDHNTDTSNNVMGSYQHHAPELLVGRGMEVTTRAGHWQALGLEPHQLVEWRYDESEGYAAAAREVRARGGLVSINHPYFNCTACDWAFDWDNNDAVEVWNGDWDVTDELALARWQEVLVQGKFTTAIGGSDSHNPPTLNGMPTIVVRSHGKSQAGIVEGVKSGHVYMVHGPGMELSFKVKLPSLVRVDTAEIGDKVKTSTIGAMGVLETKGFAGQKACFVTDRGYVFNTTVRDDGMTKRFVPVGANFMRVEMRNSTDDAMLGMTNPVWFL
ncbi:Polymerase/histidinol phosphatase-like protein [Aspergillus egyptiacus]|nr:Polymerase/histidinol phosphatase-like protein [Aspergillus egyptiacus]